MCSHIEIFLDIKNTTTTASNTDAVGIEGPGDELGEDNDSEEKGDKFFNYKNGEFFIDSIFAISTIFEKQLADSSSLLEMFIWSESH